MQSYRISRLNPKSGLVEQPYRDKEGQFILADPVGGAQRHHAKHAVRVGTTAEAVAYLEKGFPIRMTDGQSAPSLVSARSVTITPIDLDGEDESSLGSAAARNPPLAKEAVMEELKQLICVLAGHVARIGSEESAAVFMGFESQNTDPYIDRDDWQKVDLARFGITPTISWAYDYAYQTGEYWSFDENTEDRVRLFRLGIPGCSIFGDTWISQTENGLCWRICEMATARWKLQDDDPLTVRELSLLANITESATRTSLSREGRSAPDGKLSGADALSWLSSRRGFVPMKASSIAQKDKTLFWSDHAFRQLGLAEALKRLISDWKETTPEQVGQAAGVSGDFMEALMTGRPPVDIDALKRVGKALDVDVPQFVGLAVQEALKAEADRG